MKINQSNQSIPTMHANNQVGTGADVVVVVSVCSLFVVLCCVVYCRDRRYFHLIYNFISNEYCEHTNTVQVQHRSVFFACISSRVGFSWIDCFGIYCYGIITAFTLSFTSLLLLFFGVCSGPILTNN